MCKEWKNCQKNLKIIKQGRHNIWYSQEMEKLEQDKA